MDKFVSIPIEVDSKKAEIRRVIRNAQDALRTLQNDTDFLMPKTLDELTADYSRRYYQQYMDVIRKDPSFIGDEERRKKVLNKWSHKQATTTMLINTVRNTLDNWPLLKLHYDPVVRNICIGSNVSVDKVAEEMVKRPIPPLAADHFKLVQLVASAVKGLREWERQNGILKRPLRNLVMWNEEEFAVQWAAGMTVNADEDERTRTIREAQEKHIF